MPALSLAACRTADAFDSLPRNQRGSGAAIHRLRASVDLPSRSQPANDFAPTKQPFPSSSPDGAFASAAPAVSHPLHRPTQLSREPRRHSFDFSRRSARSTNGSAGGVSTSGAPSAQAPGGLLRRNSSTATSASAGSAATGLGKRLKKVSLPGSSSRPALGRGLSSVSSTDLPPASSDLGTDEDRRQPDRFAATGSSASAPSSPRKVRSAKSPLNQGIGGGGGGGDAVPRHAAAGFGGGVNAPAKKRVVDKSMIGLPTNFQHTGHIGRSDYGVAVVRTQVDATALKAQLSEVAAALGGLPGAQDTEAASTSTRAQVSGPNGLFKVAPSSAATAQDGEEGVDSSQAPPLLVQPTLDTVVEADDTTPAASRILQRGAPPADAGASAADVRDGDAAAKVGETALGLAEALELHQARRAAAASEASQRTVTAPRNDVDVSEMPRERPFVSDDVTPPTKAVDLRGVARHAVSPTSAATMGFARPSSPPVLCGEHGSPTRAAARAVSPPPVVRSPSTMSAAAAAASRSPSSSSNSSATTAAAGAGRGKRKPVPRGALELAELVSGGGDGAGAADAAASPSSPAQRLLELQRRVSTRAQRGRGSEVDRYLPPDVTGHGADVEEVDAVGRARNADGENDGKEAGGVSSPQVGLGATTTATPAEEASPPPPPPPQQQEPPRSMRVSGKRMVQGPAGEYITDTANMRWNSAMAEIASALRDDGSDDDDDDDAATVTSRGMKNGKEATKDKTATKKKKRVEELWAEKSGETEEELTRQGATRR